MQSLVDLTRGKFEKRSNTDEVNHVAKRKKDILDNLNDTLSNLADTQTLIKNSDHQISNSAEQLITISGILNGIDDEHETSITQMNSYPCQSNNIKITCEKTKCRFSTWQSNGMDKENQMDTLLEQLNTQECRKKFETLKQNVRSKTEKVHHETLLNDFNVTQFCDNSQFLREFEKSITSRKGESPNETVKRKCEPPSLPVNENKNYTENSNRRDINSFNGNKKENVSEKEILNNLSNLEKEIFRDDEDEPNVSISQLEENISNIFKLSQQRRGINLLFDNLETSIFELQPTCGADNLTSTQTVSEADETFDDIARNSNSLLAEAVSSMSPNEEKHVGNLIKQVLLKNVNEFTSPESITNKTILSCVEPQYRELGQFYGLPDKVRDLMKVYRGITELYDWQSECLNLEAIMKRQNLVYALPTSGGKTLVAEILILREIMCRKKNVLFVLPFVAIVQEKVWALSPFAVALDFLIEEYAGGKGSYPPRKRRRKNSVYIATIEKALSLTNSLIDTGRMEELGLIVVDELHLIGDASRGPTLEALLTKLMCIRINLQILGMSATIGNLDEICKFLDADVYTQNFRPVELVEYVKCGEELGQINWNATDEDKFFTFSRKLDFHYSDDIMKIDPDMLGGLVMETIPEDSCLIFCPSKKNCENVTQLLCKVILPNLKSHRTEDKKNLITALTNESGILCPIFSVSIPFGVAYHHSGLTSDERRLIEDGFRAGVISVICCTSTLAAGVNLPAKRVILRKPYIGRDFLNLARYKQMVGRAGRAGFGESGDSILITDEREMPKVKNLLMAPMDQAMSHMHDEEACGLRHFLLSCISLGIANTRHQLHNITMKTLLGVQHRRLNINLKKVTDRAISTLFKLDAIQLDGSPSKNVSANVSVQINSTTLGGSDTEGSQNAGSSKSKINIVIDNDSKLIVTKLGSAAIRGGLELSRAHVLYEDLCTAQKSLVLLSCLHLLYLITPYDVAEQVQPSKALYYQLYTRLNEDDLQTAKILGINESVAVKMLSNQPIKNIPERVLNRFYMTLVLYDLWNGVPIYEVASKFKITRGIVQNLMTTAATFTSNVIYFCMELEKFWMFAHLLKGMGEKLQHCCVKELLPLMQLPSVKQNRAKQLYKAGYKTLASIAKANPNDLLKDIEHLSRNTANQLIAASKLLLLEKIENLREEAEDVLDGIDEPVNLNYSILR